MHQTEADMDVAPWWYRIGSESPVPSRGCWQDESTTGIRTTDVYCRDHERILAISAEKPPPARWVWLGLLALAGCGAFYASGVFQSRIPVLIVALGFGALAAGLPLRRYASTWPVALTVWLCAGVAIALLQGTDTAVHNVARLVFVGLLLVFGSLRWYGTLRRRDSSTATAATALPVIVATMALLAYGMLMVNAGIWLPTPSLAVQRMLLLVGAAGWIAALITVIVTGLIDGLTVSVLPVEALMRRPASPTRRRPYGGLVGQVGATLENVLLFWVHLLATAGVLAVNTAWQVLVIIARRVRLTLIRAGQRVMVAARAMGPAALESLRVVVLPSTLLTVAAWLATTFATRVTGYLVDDVLASAALAAGAAALASLALFLAWALLASTRQSSEKAQPLPSYLHSLKVTLPYWLLVQALGGWLVGLPAALGHGQVHVGWITYATTTVLIVTFGVYLLTRDRSVEGHREHGSHRIA
jgi:hypothetical protein